MVILTVWNMYIRLSRMFYFLTLPAKKKRKHAQYNLLARVHFTKCVK